MVVLRKFDIEECDRKPRNERREEENNILNEKIWINCNNAFLMRHSLGLGNVEK